MPMRGRRRRTKVADGQIGPGFAWTIIAMIAGLIAYLYVYERLAVRTGFPESYYRCVGRRLCGLDNLWHSPALIRHGGVYELMLFGWLWLAPLLVALFARRIWRKATADRWRIR